MIYARQSLDRSGERLAVSRQLDLCRRMCEQRGWDVAAEYVDNDTSATSGVQRPEFERLLVSSPPRVVVWHVDRLVRLTRDLERVIQLGVNVHAVEAGDLDLSNPAGRAVARTVTAWSTYETEQKAVRQRVANDQRAASGEPYRCQRAFGYEADGVTIREVEAVELRACADGVVRGVSMNSMVKDLNARGVVTATGKTWRTTTLKAALLSPRNAGLRRHRGEVVGQGKWPAILDEATATTVRAILTDPARSVRGPSRRYLLSGIMRCGKCGGPITGAFIKGGKGPTYRCLGHVTRKAAPVDEAVTALVVARLASADAVDLFAAPDHTGAQRADLQSALSDARARADGLAEAFAMGEIDRQAMAKGSKRLDAEMVRLKAEMASATTDPTLSEVVNAGDVGAAFGDLPMDTQRGIIDRLVTLTLLPIGSGKRTFSLSDSIGVDWRAAE